MYVTSQANFSDGPLQHETIGQTLHVSMTSSDELISLTLNLCVFRSTYIVGSWVFELNIATSTFLSRLRLLQIFFHKMLAFD